jgi:hypothetical protein
MPTEEEEFKDNGGRAFPIQGPIDHWGHPDGGMYLRDWFAGQALTALAQDMPQTIFDDIAKETRSGRGYAKVAYALADAMLTERNK